MASSLREVRHTLGLALGARVAKSAFFDCTVAPGAGRFTVYNHMLMPVSYGDEITEYWRLIEGVVMWDVAVQMQVELAGPDGRIKAALSFTCSTGAGVANCGGS